MNVPAIFIGVSMTDWSKKIFLHPDIRTESQKCLLYVIQLTKLGHHVGILSPDSKKLAFRYGQVNITMNAAYN